MKIYCIIGCGGSGKDTLLTNIIKNNDNIKPVISYTTRPKRKNESDGVEYNFIEYDEAKNMVDNNEFIECRKYDGIESNGNKKEWIYGLAKKSIDLNSYNSYIVILDFEGYKRLKQFLKNNNKENCLTSFYIDVNKKNRLSRYLSRDKMSDYDVDEMIRRFLDDNLKVLPAKNNCNYIIDNNNNIEDALSKMLLYIMFE